MPELRAVASSALVVDIRNFTPNLYSGRTSASRRDSFCAFLTRFYNCCIQDCVTACRSGDPQDLYVNGTGDGILAVFLSRRHVFDAYLAGLMLCNHLTDLCDQYNRLKSKRVPHISFGMGIDCGQVQRVISTNEGCQVISTYVGDCINVAARLESLTKNYTRTYVLLSERANGVLCKGLFRQDYDKLMVSALNPSLPSHRRRRLWARMAKLNERLMVTFMHLHNIRGMPDALAVFRLSPTLAAFGRPEFGRLVAKLCVDSSHRREVNQRIGKV